KEKLSKEQIAILTKWVEMGVPYSGGADTAANAVAVKQGPPRVDDQAKKFWSFVPVKRPQVPQIKKGDWVRNPIDAFILAKLEEKGRSPAPPVEKVALLRRAYYDLIGLPPTPGEVDAFLADDSPDAYERVIEKLLAMPQYGEKWGRYWLDLV